MGRPASCQRSAPPLYQNTFHPISRNPTLHDNQTIPTQRFRSGDDDRGDLSSSVSRVIATRRSSSSLAPKRTTPPLICLAIAWVCQGQATMKTALSRDESPPHAAETRTEVFFSPAIRFNCAVDSVLHTRQSPWYGATEIRRRSVRAALHCPGLLGRRILRSPRVAC